MEILKTDLDLPLLSMGKVRDTYILDNKLLMVSTDRMSAFDVVFNEPIPHKGEVLNKLSIFWFNQTRHIIENHFISDQIPNSLPKYLNNRSMIVKKAKPIQLECVVRGYVTGGGWKEYQQKGSICGVKLPIGLKNGSQLPQPIFTPTTKAHAGHDESINEVQAIKLVGDETYYYIKEKSIELYNFGKKHAEKCGLILADTKFEFGFLSAEGSEQKNNSKKIILIDEALTPDSSRYWIKDKYDQGVLESLDKQFLRDYLEKTNWDKTPPAPKLPKEIIEKTSKRYVEAYEKLTGKKF